jgi:hypothetical protein
MRSLQTTLGGGQITGGIGSIGKLQPESVAEAYKKNTALQTDY